MCITAKDLDYRSVQPPRLGVPSVKPAVPARVFEGRLDRLKEAMSRRGLDVAVIYADREHYGNFKYFTGFDPRFEEALLFVHLDGRVFCALGNECLSLGALSKIPMTAVLCQCLSLPDQPMDQFVSMEHTAAQCGVKKGMRVGAVDWKLFQNRHSPAFRSMSGMPAYLVDALAAAAGGREQVVNATDLLIGAPHGLRCRTEAEAIAEFEFGAACASQSVLDMLEAAQPGMSEREIAAAIQTYGQPLSCHSYVVAGENTRKGLISPSDYKTRLGDELVASVGMEGGLTCRHVMLAGDESQIAVDGAHYMEQVVKPYLAVVFNWFEMIGLGVRCGDIYDMVARQIPKEQYGWSLNPGHMIGYEEWMCSPVYPGSQTVIESGMMFQMDIIPTDPVYCAPNAEDGLVIADKALRAQLQRQYPQVYGRMMARRAFAEQQIGLKLKPEVLPLSNCFACFNPYSLQKNMAIVIR